MTKKNAAAMNEQDMEQVNGGMVIFSAPSVNNLPKGFPIDGEPAGHNWKEIYDKYIKDKK